MQSFDEYDLRTDPLDDAPLPDAADAADELEGAPLAGVAPLTCTPSVPSTNVTTLTDLD
jgi:hypothetical protein